uniref:Uncharacterized protein n=1 Tax=Opuntia streptacantha TaxID=393608 RepID=A0A7C9DL75_OPUST
MANWGRRRASSSRTRSSTGSSTGSRSSSRATARHGVDVKWDEGRIETSKVREMEEERETAILRCRVDHEKTGEEEHFAFISTTEGCRFDSHMLGLDPVKGLH